MSALSDKYKISVIIPAYNSQDTIVRALGSVLSQSYTPFEILVIDDGSSDRTAELAKGFPEIKYVYKENGGASSARNKGIETASGNWIAFLDSDDFWKPFHLDKIVSIIDKYDLNWACGSFEYSDSRKHDKDKTKWKSLLADGCHFDDFYKAYAFSAPVHTDGMVIKKEVFDQVGVFDTNFAVGEDLDLWFRIAHKFPKIGLLIPPSVIYQRRTGSLMDVHGDKAETFLNLLKRHHTLVSSINDEKLKQFTPLGRRLASMAFQRAIRYNNKEVLKELLNGFSVYLKDKKALAFLALYFPFSITLWNSYVRFGVKCKSLLRRLNLIS